MVPALLVGAFRLLLHAGVVLSVARWTVRSTPTVSSVREAASLAAVMDGNCGFLRSPVESPLIRTIKNTPAIAGISAKCVLTVATYNNPAFIARPAIFTMQIELGVWHRKGSI
jgi:hypothetical protein